MHSASSPRWESGDRPALEAAFTAAGFESDIQNAEGDESKYATIGDQQLSKGCGVMILVNYNDAGVAVANTSDINATPSYEQICENAGLRAVERADCHAQMKAAQNDEQRRSIYHVFDVRVNGALAGDPPAPAADTEERPAGQ